MKYAKLLLVLLIFYLFGCDSITDNNQNFSTIDLLKKEWINSFEEQTNKTKIFRPFDYKDFPISRYRQAFIFEDNNKCKYLVIGDTDLHYYKDGIWVLKNNDKLIVITDTNNHIKYQLEIVELSENILKCNYVN